MTMMHFVTNRAALGGSILLAMAALAAGPARAQANDGTVLPFAPAPMAGVAVSRLQDSNDDLAATAAAAA